MKLNILVIFCFYFLGIHKHQLLAENVKVWDSVFSADTINLKNIFVDTSLIFKEIKALNKYGNEQSKKIFEYAKTSSEKIADSKKRKFYKDSLILLNQDLYTVLLIKSLRRLEKSVETIRLLSYNLAFSNLVSTQQRIDVFNMYPSNVRNTVDGKKVFNQINSYNSNNGQFITKNAKLSTTIIKSMRNVKLSLNTVISDKRFNYYLLVFGASWCSPCRYENIVLNKLIPQIDTMQIKIIGISIDESEIAWKNAVKQDSCHWANYILIDGPRAQFFEQNVTKGVPYNILFDHVGQIIKSHNELKVVLNALPATIYAK